MNISNIENMAIKHNQYHLIEHYNSLDEDKKETFLKELMQIDFDLIDNLYKTVVNAPATALLEVAVDNVSQVKCYKKSDNYQRDLACGLKIVQENKVVVFILAGGQGTRLNHDGPKGTFYVDLGELGKKSIFELHMDKMNELYLTTGQKIHVYIMTSEINHNITVDFFIKNNYFSYGEENITFIKQKMLPAIDTNGKIILEDIGKIAFSPDGNGGFVDLLKETGNMDKMIKNGVEWLFVSNIDNILSDLADPAFFGQAINNSSDLSTKVVKKVSASERMGVFANVDGKLKILEYTEMPDWLLNMRDENGELSYPYGNIASYIFNVDKLNSLNQTDMPYHEAFKKIPYLDISDGVFQIVKPDSPNGYKFEKFIFDIFSSFENPTVYEVIREREFAPIKNEFGADSPESASKLYLNAYKNRS